ncbi:MAG: hypothetical protein AAGG68_14830 [Bacteroidota bacterium]
MAERIVPIRIDLNTRDFARESAKLKIELEGIRKQIKLAKEASDEDVLGGLIQGEERLKQELLEVNRSLRLQSKEFNNQKASLPIESLKQLRVEYSKLKRSLVELDVNSPEFAKQSKEAFALGSRIQSLERDFSSFGSSVGDYERAFSSALEASIQASGRLLGGGSVLDDLASLSLIGGGAGAIFGTVLETSSEALEVVSALVDEITRLKTTINVTTGLEGSELLSFTAQLKGVTDILETDVEETLGAVNSAARTFGRDFSESLDVVEKGLIRVSNRDEFLDNIREYSSAAKDAGIAFEDFISILISSQQSGSFNDTVIDGILLDGIVKIREASDSTRSALESAFGKKFTDNLFKNIRTGSITAIEGLQEVAEAIEKGDLNGQQLQQVVSTLFSTGGETSERVLLETLRNIGDETSRAIDFTSSYITRLEELSKQSKRLATEQTLLATQLSGLKDAFELTSLQIKTSFIAETNKALILLRTFSVVASRLANGNFKEAFNFQSIQKELAAAAKSTKEAQKIADELGKTGEETGDKITGGTERARTAFQRLKDESRELADQIQLGLLNGSDTDTQIARYRQITSEIERINDRFRELTELQAQVDENSLQALKSALTDINSEIARTDDETLLTQLTQQAIDLEESVSNAEGRLLFLRRQATGGLVSEIAPLDGQTALSELSPLQSDGTNNESEAIAAIERIAQQRIVKLQEAALSESITNEELAQQRVAIEEQAEIDILNLKLSNDQLAADAELKLRTSLNDKLLSQAEEQQEAFDKVFDIEKFKEYTVAAIDVAQTVSRGIFRIEEQRIEQQQDKQLEALEEEYNAKLAASENNSILQTELRKEQEAKEEAILRESYENQKRLDIANALISSSLAFIRTLASPIPFPGNVIAAGTVAATAALEVAQIRAQQFEQGGLVLHKGGLLKGKSHKQGGIPIEAEGGEFIVNRLAVSSGNNLALLEQINNSVKPSRRQFENGGFVSPLNPNTFTPVPFPSNPTSPLSNTVVVNPSTFMAEARIEQASIDAMTQSMNAVMEQQLGRLQAKLPMMVRTAIEDGMVDAATSSRRIDKRRRSARN